MFETLGGRMRAVRLAKGLTTEQLAEKLKVSRPTVTQWETGTTEKIPDHRIEAFARVTGVSKQWLQHHTGTAPKLDFSNMPRKMKMNKKFLRSAKLTYGEADAPMSLAIEALDARILEIKPRLSAHAKTLDTTAQALWAIPREVLSLDFNCDPDQALIKRSLIDGPPLPDGTPVCRGDYALIDATRNVINEPGLYYVADPEGKEVRRVIVVGAELAVTLQSTGEAVNKEDLVVLGRVMAVFHAL